MKKSLENKLNQYIYVILFILIILGITSASIAYFTGKLNIKRVTDREMFLLVNGSAIIVLGTVAVLYRNRTLYKNSIDAIIKQKGYLLIDMPEKYRSLFEDMLRGFEDYCATKGYNIKVSIDNTFQDKIGFKIHSEDDKVSEDQLRDDYKDYTAKLALGDKFDDITTNDPVVFQRILKLQNRVNLLENDKRNLEGMLKFHEKFSEKIAKSQFKAQPVQQYFVLGENGAISQVEQNLGHGSIAINGHNNEAKNRVKISNSFNTRQKQIGKIDEILSLLKSDEKNNQDQQEHLSNLVTNLHQLKGTLKEEEDIDQGKVAKWLQAIKTNAERLILVHDTKESLDWLIDSFKFVSDLMG
ncbi:MAG TPA: hypothetical protein VK154_01400 [Chitinophagales bacterium]|nr:hypothetical protein [Chitinophagales bacterium]